MEGKGGKISLCSIQEFSKKGYGKPHDNSGEDSQSFVCDSNPQICRIQGRKSKSSTALRQDKSITTQKLKLIVVLSYF